MLPDNYQSGHFPRYIRKQFENFQCVKFHIFTYPVSCRDDRVDRIEEPPPDYSPPSPPPMPRDEKKHYQKTRFAAEVTPKAKSGNIIGKQDKIAFCAVSMKLTQYLIFRQKNVFSKIC